MKNKKYILAIDQGTSSSRAILFDRKSNIIAVAQKEFKQYFPKPAWVEHDAEEILKTQIQVIKAVVKKAKIKASTIAAIGITNQRETTVVWDRATGKPIHKAIVWQDRRTASICDAIRKKGLEKMIRSKTGLFCDPYFSATKIKWILDNVKGARAKAAKAELAFGTIDSWLIWNLSSDKIHATDVTNASRTMLLNIKSCKWDNKLLECFEIPKSVLPELKTCSELYGYLDKSILGVEIPISGVAGDQQAALFGQMCTKKGMAKNTYGTGCFLMMNTGDKIVRSKNKLLSTIAWKVDGKINYALEGSVFVGGAVIQWLRDGLEIVKKASDTESLSAEDNGGVYFVPALTGLGAPYWNDKARGLIIGLTRGTKRGHIIRAALESIAFQSTELVNAMQKDTKAPLRELRVDGGAVTNEQLLQIQANQLGKKVVRPKVLETTALGAAYFAGLAVGFWKNREDISSAWKIDKVFKSKIGTTKRKAAMTKWQKAVQRSLDWDA